jgi:hypothetical protein
MGADEEKMEVRFRLKCSLRHPTFYPMPETVTTVNTIQYKQYKPRYHNPLLYNHQSPPKVHNKTNAGLAGHGRTSSRGRVKPSHSRGIVTQRSRHCPKTKGRDTRTTDASALSGSYGAEGEESRHWETRNAQKNKAPKHVDYREGFQQQGPTQKMTGSRRRVAHTDRFLSPLE